MVMIMAMPVFFLFFSSCSDEDKPAWYHAFRIDIATAYTNTGDIYFTLDNGTKLNIAPESDYALPTLTNQQRVLLQYTTSAEKENAITIYGLSLVNSATIINLTEESEEFIGNDPIEIESAWISGDFLNLIFYFYRDSKSHLISLGESRHSINRTDTIFLELRHNAYDDAVLFKEKGIVSFDISSYKELKPVVFSIENLTYEGSVKRYNRLCD